MNVSFATGILLPEYHQYFMLFTLLLPLNPTAFSHCACTHPYPCKIEK